MSLNKKQTLSIYTFEVTETTLQISNEQTHASIRISSIYRTCGRNSSAEHLSKFFDEFDHYLSTLTSKPGFPIVSEIRIFISKTITTPHLHHFKT